MRSVTDFKVLKPFASIAFLYLSLIINEHLIKKYKEWNLCKIYFFTISHETNQTYS